MTGRPRRLHVGCGPRVAPRWLNADRRPLPGVDLVGDLTVGLALPDRAVDYAVWYGSVRTPFTWDFALECCETAGFARVVRCAAHETSTPWADITAFDDRERETLFV